MAKVSIPAYLRVQISEGNSKLGAIPSVSLPPGLSCSTTAQQTCLLDGCYAFDSYRQYPAVRHGQLQNYWIYKVRPVEYERQIMDYLERKKPKRFRWHVSGDCPDVPYCDMVDRIASANRRVSFLLFTKRPLYWFQTCTSKNLVIRFSKWPGVGMSNDTEDIRKAYMRDTKSPEYVATDIPKNAFKCKGSCETCSACFGTKHKDVVFDKH